MDNQLIRTQVLNPGTARDEAYLDHPLVTGRVEIPTPEVQRAYEETVAAIVKRRPGLCYYGEFRAGKTFAISLLQRNLPQSFAHLPIRSIVAKDHEKPTEKALFSDMLFDLDHAAHDKGSAPDRRIRLIEHLRSLACDRGSDKLLLFVDEAQNYSIPDLSRLKDIGNDLGRIGISLTVIFFGDCRLLNMRAALTSRQRTDIVGRFFLHSRPFNSVNSLEDACSILRALDDPEVSSYPPGSGISYTEFFQHPMYSRGWRLTDEAPKCWQAFATIGRCAAEDLRVGMQWFMSTASDFLFGQHSLDVDRLPAWIAAVKASGFESANGIQRP
ncbi:ATP-binding protein [Achromobacter mucicolens]|uniref:ATP-binding protein n=1 Tax=Achromobacter mucicolens TaxID=1389922 RepID=UPI001CBDF54F|nr:ATP-binding protein [Achromobacter mucicolens]UAN03652.1 ATP-binding protein [Achromobacter mucicolens]